MYTGWETEKLSPSLKGMLDSSGNQLKDTQVSLLTDDSNNTYLQVTNVGQVLLQVQIFQFQLEEPFIFLLLIVLNIQQKQVQRLLSLYSRCIKSWRNITATITQEEITLFCKLLHLNTQMKKENFISKW